MKIIILIFLCLIFSSVLLGQDAKEILRRSFEKCQSIKNGHYVMIDSMKYPGKNDTLTSTYNCYFKKRTGDSLFSSAFHYNQKNYHVLYTGNELVTFSQKDSTGIIMLNERWAADIKSRKHNYNFYSPLTNKESFPLPKDSDYIDNKHLFKFIGEEILNGIACYHIRYIQVPEIDLSSKDNDIRREYNFWISKVDMIPVQYDFAIDMTMENDTMYQYEKKSLKEYELNNLKDDTPLTLSSVPDYIFMSDYRPWAMPEPLPKDTIAPEWSLVSLKNEKVSLSSLKGKLVLVDFFYQACYPCVQALPILKSLDDKYKSKGLRIVGIDPHDKNDQFFKDFLAKRGITYTILLEGKDVASTYNVGLYPTMYLIDKNGKIVYSHLGYTEGVEKELEEIIKKYL